MFDCERARGLTSGGYDYANFSAHLFLANSYDLLRDPNRVNLRYATPAESEYLIANLLAPVGVGAWRKPSRRRNIQNYLSVTGLVSLPVPNI